VHTILAFCPRPKKIALRLGGIVLGEVLVTVGVGDGLRRVADSKFPAGSLTVSVIAGATVDGEVGGLVDKRSGLGIGTDGGGVPESTAQIDLSE